MKPWHFILGIVVLILLVAVFWQTGKTRTPPRTKPFAEKSTSFSPSGAAQQDDAPAKAPVPSRTASPDKMTDALQILDPQSRRSALRKLGAAYGKSDPRGGWAQLATVSGLQDRQEFAGALIEEWSRQSTTDALGACAGLPPGELQAACTAKAIGVWAETSPQAAMEWASHSLTGSIRQMAVAEAAGQWARQDPQTAAQWAAERENSTSAGTALSEVMGYWAETDPQGAAAWAAKLPDGSLKNAALSSLVLNWADQFPNEAATWAATQEGKPELLELAGSAWAKTDPVGAATWASSLKNPESRSEILSTTLATWAAASPQSALAWVAQTSSPDTEPLRETILGQWAGEDPSAALSWAQSNNLPEAGQAIIFRQWAATTPETLENWVDSQPPQNRPDTALNSLALSMAEENPPTALLRASTIQDPRTRAKTLRKILSHWEDTDATAAAAWLAAHPEKK